MSGYRLAPQQRRLFRLAAADAAAAPPGGAGRAYSSGAVFRLAGELDRPRLEDAFARLVARYEILTSDFPRLPGLELPVQQPGARDDAEIRFVAAARPAAEELSDACRRILAADGEPPGLRLRLVGLAPADHLLVWTQPSLYGDGASIVNLVDELLRFYTADTASGGPDEAPMQYADLAQWLNEILEDDEAADGIAYWRRQASAAASAPFPLASRGPRGAFAPALLRLPLAARHARALRQRAGALGVSLESLLHALWAALLARYLDSATLRLDTLFDGRSYEGLQEAVGLLARHLPIAVEPRGGETIDELAARLAASCAEAADWQEYFSHEEGAAARRGSGYGFAFHEVRPAEYGGLRSRPVAVHATLEPHLLELVCCDSGDELDLALLFDLGALAPAMAAEVAASWAALVEDALERPRQPLGELSVLGARTPGPATPAPAPDPPPTAFVIDLVGQQAVLHPQRAAAVCGDDATTYAALWDRAGGIAARLQHEGVERDELVAVCCERSLDLVAALLGVLRSGAAYLPLDPANPDDRLAFMARDAGARWGLFHAATAPRLADLPADALPGGRLDLAEIGAGEPDAARPRSGDDLAYAIFTSGSTGVPKGVAVTQSNLAHSTAARLQVYPGSPRRFLLLSSYAFDSSAVGLFWTLATGGTLILPQEGTEQDIGLIAGTIERVEVTHTLCLPTFYALLLEELGGAGSLEVVVVAGEPCPAGLARRHFELRPGTLLVNEYGPTEATVWATASVLTPDSIAPSVPIGRPIPYATVRLLDAAGQPVPMGVPGEIHIGGAGIARGYLRRPELTAERFLEDRSAGAPGARLYRTGDRARQRPDGQIEFLGRVDHQIKLRGYRIEPGEIEVRLEEHPGVRQAIVAVRRAAGGETRLVAWVVPASAAAPNVSELRSALQRHLPEYMIPAAFVVLEELPLTATGKVDRGALPEPEHQRPDLATAYEPAASPLERRMVAMWQEILQTDDIGVADDFFELGGNSIQAAIFMNRLRGEMDDFIHVGRLFEQPTIRRLAAYLERHHAGAIGRLGERGVAPPAQPAADDELAGRIAEMSDEQVDEMLEDLLAERERGV